MFLAGLFFVLHLQTRGLSPPRPLRVRGLAKDANGFVNRPFLPSFLRLPVSSAAFPSVLHVATFREIEMRGKWSEMRPEDECWALKGPRRRPRPPTPRR